MVPKLALVSLIFRLLFGRSLGGVLGYFWKDFGGQFGPSIDPKGTKREPKGLARATSDENKNIEKMCFSWEGWHFLKPWASQDSSGEPKKLPKRHLGRSMTSQKIIKKRNRFFQISGVILVWFWGHFGPQNRNRIEPKTLLKISLLQSRKKVK